MKKTLLKGLNVLSVSLIISSCELNPFAIDTKTAELVRTKKDVVERISCYDNKANSIMCFDQDDLNIINKCMRRCGNKK